MVSYVLFLWKRLSTGGVLEHSHGPDVPMDADEEVTFAAATLDGGCRHSCCMFDSLQTCFLQMTEMMVALELLISDKRRGELWLCRWQGIAALYFNAFCNLLERVKPLLPAANS